MNNETQSPQKETKHVTLGFALAWIVGILFGISGLALLFTKPLPGILLLIAGLVALPFINTEVKKQWHISLSGGLRTVLVIILFIVSVALINNGTPAATQPVAQSVPAAPDATSVVSTPVSHPAVIASVAHAAPVTHPATPTIPAPAPVVAAAPQALLDISGTGSKSTESFTAAGDWTLNWSYDCSNFGNQGNFQVYIENSNGGFNDNIGVNELGNSGTDTNYYHEGGTYYLEVNSECAWHVTVKG